MNWNQTGMPAALVSRLGRKREVTEFKSVLNDACNQVLRPIDVEAMTEELVKSGGREFVEMVRELTTSLENARRELEQANRRYGRLTAELAKRGVDIDLDGPVPAEGSRKTEAGPEASPGGRDEWEEWDRRFRSLLG